MLAFNNKITQLFKLCSKRVIVAEKIRFVLSGISVNGIGFLLYIILVEIWFPPKEALTILYWLAVTVTFAINKKLVFKHEGFVFFALVKYIFVYFMGYFISLLVMTICLDWFIFNYVISMIIASMMMPVYFYTMQKYLVFK